MTWLNKKSVSCVAVGDFVIITAIRKPRRKIHKNTANFKKSPNSRWINGSHSWPYCVHKMRHWNRFSMQLVLNFSLSARCMWLVAANCRKSPWIATCQDFFNHPPLRLTSRKTNMVGSGSSLYYIPVEKWKAVSLCGLKNLISDPTIRLPGFDLCRSTWSILNRFRTGQGRCAANLYKWHMVSTYQCGAVQTMNHIVESCPLIRFNDVDVSQLHSVDDCAITWLQKVAVKAFALWVNEWMNEVISVHFHWTSFWVTE